MAFQYIIDSLDSSDMMSDLDAKWSNTIVNEMRQDTSIEMMRSLASKIPDSCVWSLKLFTLYVVCYWDHGVELTEEEHNMFAVVESVMDIFALRDPSTFVEQYVPVTELPSLLAEISPLGALWIEQVLIVMLATPGYFHRRKYRLPGQTTHFNRAVRAVIEQPQPAREVKGGLYVPSPFPLDNDTCIYPGCRRAPCRYTDCTHVSCHKRGVCTQPLAVSISDPDITLRPGNIHATPRILPNGELARPAAFYGEWRVEDGMAPDRAESSFNRSLAYRCQHVGCSQLSCYICDYDKSETLVGRHPMRQSYGIRGPGQALRSSSSPEPEQVVNERMSDEEVRAMTRHRAIEILAFHKVKSNPYARYDSQYYMINVAFGQCNAGRTSSACGTDTYVLSGSRRPTPRDREVVELELLRVGRCLVNGHCPFPRRAGWRIIGQAPRCGCGCGQ